MWDLVAGGVMRCRGFRWIVGGIWRGCSIWILIVRGRRMCGRAGLLRVGGV